MKTAERQPRAEAQFLELKLEDDTSQKTALKGGYDPYDRELVQKGKTEARHQNTDLRKLSEWIRLQREVEELKKHDEAEAIAAHKRRST